LLIDRKLPLNMVKNAVFRVLLIDDSVLVGARILNFLSTIPSLELLEQARTINEGLGACMETNPDIVLLDVNLPDGTGIKLLKELKSRLPHIWVIMLTNSSNEFYRIRCAELGAEFFLDKTKDFPRILEILHLIIT
jgi:DNA-binding NarL/FixJ family response regulator